MRILLTGATGYIGKRLLPKLLEKNFDVICAVRDKKRFTKPSEYENKVEIIEVDFLKKETLKNIPKDIDIAFYLIHSMSSNNDDFEDLESKSAINFRDYIKTTKIRQLIYLSGIVNEEKLSKHLRSRKKVENILKDSTYNTTVLRAGIIVGSGSASFEIIRDLVEKLPVMITPKWLNTKTQPIASNNIIEFLSSVIDYKPAFNNSYDIGGTEILSYKEMLLQYAEIRKLKRFIYTVPVMTPRLSSYWLYFVTSTNYKLAVNLVNSMKIEVIAKPNNLHNELGIKLLSYKEAVNKALTNIDDEKIISRWTDAQTSRVLEKGISELIKVPEYGCFKDKREIELADPEKSFNKIWSIGGENGWYYGNYLWGLRGFVDKLFGGVGLRRGRKSKNDINVGESLDFWRVIVADEENKRLLLYAEMKLPGEAWLEFKILDNKLYQTATFRPLGLWGRIYWYSVLPFHSFIFKGMMKNIAY